MAQVVIDPEFPIGTEVWILHKNAPLMGLVAAYDVRVTSYTDIGKGWAQQLFKRFLNKTHKDEYNYSIQYTVKFNPEFSHLSEKLEKRCGVWMLYDRPVYLSLEDLKAAIR